MEKITYIHQDRDIPELLEALFQGVHKYMSYFPFFRKGKPNTMCAVASRMESDNYLSFEEYLKLKDFLKINCPRNMAGVAKPWWKVGKKAPRVLWLKNMINNPQTWNL